MTEEQYTDAIQKINDELRPSRSKQVDKALLATGVLMVPLAIWGTRHAYQTKKRKHLLKKAIESFNEANPNLLMRWNRRPDSFLTIEQRSEVVVQEVETIPEATAEPFESFGADQSQQQQLPPRQLQTTMETHNVV